MNYNWSWFPERIVDAPLKRVFSGFVWIKKEVGTGLERGAGGLGSGHVWRRTQ